MTKFDVKVSKLFNPMFGTSYFGKILKSFALFGLKKNEIRKDLKSRFGDSK